MLAPEETYEEDVARPPDEVAPDELADDPLDAEPWLEPLAEDDPPDAWLPDE